MYKNQKQTQRQTESDGVKEKKRENPSQDLIFHFRMNKTLKSFMLKFPHIFLFLLTIAHYSQSIIQPLRRFLHPHARVLSAKCHPGCLEIKRRALLFTQELLATDKHVPASGLFLSLSNLIPPTPEITRLNICAVTHRFRGLSAIFSFEILFCNRALLAQA